MKSLILAKLNVVSGALAGLALAELGVEHEGVEAGIAGQLVAAGAAIEPVVAVAAGELVVALAALEFIAAGESGDLVVAAPAVDAVVGRGRQRLPEHGLLAVDHVVLVRPSDLDADVLEDHLRAAGAVAHRREHGGLRSRAA